MLSTAPPNYFPDFEPWEYNHHSNWPTRSLDGQSTALTKFGRYCNYITCGKRKRSTHTAAWVETRAVITCKLTRICSGNQITTNSTHHWWSSAERVTLTTRSKAYSCRKLLRKRDHNYSVLAAFELCTRLGLHKRWGQSVSNRPTLKQKCEREMGWPESL